MPSPDFTSVKINSKHVESMKKQASQICDVTSPNIHVLRAIVTGDDQGYTRVFRRISIRRGIRQKIDLHPEEI